VELDVSLRTLPTGTSVAESMPLANESSSSRLLIIDDEQINVRVLREYLRLAGFVNVEVCCDSRNAMELFTQYQPDLVLLDAMMPQISGLEILHEIRSGSERAFTPVVMVTADTSPTMRLQALERGATDFLQKPVDPAELITRVRNMLIVKQYHDEVATRAEKLDQMVRKRTAELEESRMQIIQCLARAAEFRDNETGQHVVRVGRYARLLAEELGLAPNVIELISLAAPLHDIGKIGLPDSILHKPGKLNEEEIEQMRKHCEYGQRMLDPTISGIHRLTEATTREDGQYTLIEMVRIVTISHHERWDGTGYPLGLRGLDIPLPGRIVAVADVFDALSQSRSYKPAFPLDRCLEVMQEGRGTHFDPRVLDAFIARFDDVRRIFLETVDG
jgi:putative two-component system response regulator